MGFEFYYCSSLLLGFSPICHTLREKCIVRLLTGDVFGGRRMYRSLHGQGHTEPFFRFSHPDITIGFSGDCCSRCRFRGHSTKDALVAARLSRFDDAEQMVAYSMPCIIPLSLCNFLEHFVFLPSTSTLDHNEFSLRLWCRSCWDLCSSGSASASRAPRTICC